MRSIKELPLNVSSRIAAGEVIENPASVVKELMENSIDAGSQRIEVRIVNGGKSSISVEDNGTGILFEELPLSIKRFATSKIEDIDDLSRIESFGYRGEALASICAVSRLEIRSYRCGSENGGILRASGEEILLHVPLQAQTGTRIQVEDLFYNLPGRKNFLKSASAESRKVTGLIRDYSAAFPEISFLAFLDGKNIYSSEGLVSRESVLEMVWGTSKNIRLSDFCDRGVCVEAAWYPSPGSRRKDITVFVNGRRVREPAVAAAAASCGDAVAGNWMFFITVPSGLIDVNIHPGKTEVRVHSSLPLFENVRSAVGALVDTSHVTPEFLGKRAGSPGVSNPVSSIPVNSIIFDKNSDDMFERVSEPPFEYPRQETNSLVAPGTSFIGQTGSGYLLYNGDDELIVVDPHAAHERILFEDLLMKNKCRVPQNMPFPEQIPPTLSERIAELRESLEKSGFRFEERSGALFLCAFPEGLGSGYFSTPIENLRSLINMLEDPNKERSKEVDERKLSGMACKGAVKLGDSISREEALRLLEDLGACRTPSMCPHGRPTMIRLRSEDLARLFGRK